MLGKYHPHGDASAYDALVRMAQDFSLRYPLIDGQGNFGSRDGDSAAAIRYTECRLTPIAELLLSEIDQDTVDFVAELRRRVPGAEAPARAAADAAAERRVGRRGRHGHRDPAAQHARSRRRGGRDDPQSEDRHRRAAGIIQGPDFPGGGQIISAPRTIRAVYETGRGSLRVRARWKVENLARGQWRVAVTELPPASPTRA